MKYEKLILIGLTYMLVRLNIKTSYDNSIKSISQHAGNSPHLVKAIIKVESGFNPKARRKTKNEDSRGLGQINEDTAKRLGVSDKEKLFDPDYNILIMNRLLSDLKLRYDSIFDIISAYNAGRPLVNKEGKYVNSAYVNNVYANFLLYSIFDI